MTDLDKLLDSTPKAGVYKHYKGGLYQFIGSSGFSGR